MSPPEFEALAWTLGAEISGPLTSALERVTALTTHGRIDRPGLLALRQELEAVRRAGMAAQQLGRFASGRVRAKAEPLNLTALLRDALAQRSREFVARQIELRQSMHTVVVLADAAYSFTLIQSLLDWVLAHAHRLIEMRLEVLPSPVHARLVLNLRRLPPPAGERTDDAAPTLSWRLAEVASRAMALRLHRDDAPDESRVTLEFPRTVNEQLEGASAIDLTEPFAASTNSKPLAGTHVLVVAARRELRVAVRDALRHMGLMVDFTSSVDEAREFAESGLPHAVIYQATLAGERFVALQREWGAESPTMAFIALDEEGHHYEADDIDGLSVIRLGRDALATALPSALLYELSRGLDTN